MFYSCKIEPQGDTQNKMAVKVIKKVKYAMALYHKINATRSTFYMKFSKSAHHSHYICRSTNITTENIFMNGHFLYIPTAKASPLNILLHKEFQ